MRTRWEEGKNGGRLRVGGWSPKFMRCSKVNAKKKTQKDKKDGK